MAAAVENRNQSIITDPNVLKRFHKLHNHHFYFALLSQANAATLPRYLSYLSVLALWNVYSVSVKLCVVQGNTDRLPWFW